MENTVVRTTASSPGKNLAILFGVVVLVAALAFAFLGPLFAPHNPSVIHLEEKLQGSSHKYPLGTDSLGRCLLSRLVYGLRTSLLLAATIMVVRLLLGTVLGILAGYYGGVINQVVGRLVDLELAFPGIILAIVVIGMLGTGMANLLLALSIVGWSKYTRVLRSIVASLKEREFVEAARAGGALDSWIMLRHVLPNCMWPITPLATMGLGSMMISIGALSFLGLGVSPGTAELGIMIKEGYEIFPDHPHLVLFPSFLIAFTVTGFSFLGDGLRDVLDPKG